ncbi:uncharacterized protein BXZ73DRAFT_37760 [Epithele typhae]|uniref:uncharacterized protein n=1 Tax=Epithele typhae TaxID=378194 RepID=UPI002007A14A|nr:uncharacterized protein BXZ73DRAFT_37760 [Epithele typhae]KAH9946167.1 hypothetical protein BXZ73DRAFT_37760 [Epithele typhae]
MHPTLISSTFVLLLATTGASAQTLVNGQIFTNGLAIVDAPAPNSPLHAGSATPIAIDISGDGHLDQRASVPGSGASTRFDSLELYLVSYATKLNLTVSSGPGLLEQEQGSTVKHLSFNVSSCVPAGDYNLTLYEGSHIDGAAYFSITPYPVTVMNDRPSDACTDDTNALQAFPQQSSPPPQTPWLNGTTVTTTASGESRLRPATAMVFPLAAALLALAL